MNGNFLLPPPRVQRHRQPAVVQIQLLPAGVEPFALGIVHGAGEQGVNIAIGVAAPDQTLALHGDPVQAKRPRYSGAYRRRASSAPSRGVPC